jgi:hypothetical protein
VGRFERVLRCISSFEGKLIRLFGADHGGFAGSRRLTDVSFVSVELGPELIQGLLKPSHAAAVCRDTVLQRSR